MESRQVNKKIALITGSTKSIGAAIAKAFCDEGAIVIVSGRKLEIEEKSIALSLGAAAYVRLNVSEEKDWKNVMSFIGTTFGKLDILVNNAGIDVLDETSPQNPEHMSIDDWRKIFSINVEGVFLGCKYAIPLMKHSENPCIINIGSRSSLVGVPMCAAYAASKATITNYTKSVAAYGVQLYREKKSDNPIRCVEIQPANIKTNMWGFGGDAKALENYSNKLPFKRMGDPSEVARLAISLAANKYISGSSHLIDGGVMMSTGSYSSSESPTTPSDEKLLAAPSLSPSKTTGQALCTAPTYSRFFFTPLSSEQIRPPLLFSRL